MKQKLTVFLLMIYCCLLLSGIHSVSAATSGTCGNLTWTLDDAGTLTISGTGAMPSWDYSSAPWYPYSSKVKKVVIGNSVTTIGNRAFRGCNSLTSVTIGDSVTSIGEYAFDACYRLTSVTIGDSVTTIGDRAFMNCTSLTSITIGDSVTSIYELAFFYCPSLTSIIVDENNANFSSIDGNLFDKNHTTLIQYAIGKTKTAYVIPDSVTSIGDSAFHSCTNLTSITIPDSVTSIGNRAFERCTSLTSITIPDSVTSIGAEAFFDCDSLTSVTIGDSVTSIGAETFYACDSLTNITVDENNANFSSIDGNFFDKNHTTLIQYAIGKIETAYVIPDSVISIGEDAFAHCTSLTSITIPDSVTSIGDTAFEYCTSLTSVTIPDSVTTIGNRAFVRCTSLTSVTIGNGVTNIGDEAFYRCSSLTSVTIGNSVTSIGRYAFEYCTSLTSVTIPDSVISIGSYAFDSCTSLTSVTIGNSVTTIGDSAFHSCTNLTSITIPDSVTSIGRSAFYECTSLTSVTIGNSVTTIGDSAFFDCLSLTDVYYHGTAEEWNAISIGRFNYELESATRHYVVSVTLLNSDGTEYAKWTQLPGTVLDVDKIPATEGASMAVYKDSDMTQEYDFDTIINEDTVLYVKVIVASGTCGTNLTWTLNNVGILTISGTGAMPSWTSSSAAPWYSNRSKVKKVVIGNSITSIGRYAFDSCTSLTSITIPDSVTTIGDYAFRNCTSLISITIGDSVTSIGRYAFYACTSLTDVYYNGTAEEWNAISIGSGNTSLKSATRHYFVSVTLLNPDGTEYAKWIQPIGTALDVDKIPEMEDASIAVYKDSDMTQEYDLDTIINENIVLYVKVIVASGTCGKNLTWTLDDTGTLTISGNGDMYSWGYYSSVPWYSNCSKVKKVVIGNSVTSIGYAAFNSCTSLTSITIPDSVSTIGRSAFSDCKSLTSVTIPDSVTSIGSDAFSGTAYYNDSSNWENNVLYIGNHLIKAKTSLTGVYQIKDKTKSIADYAFSACDSLTSITIPDSVTSIGRAAFSNCTSLTSVTIGDSVTSIGYDAFRNCDSLTSIIVDENNANFSSLDGNLFDKNHTTLIQYATGKTETAYVIPDSVTIIGDYAFLNCTSLTSITIPDSVTTIGDCAFRDCPSLTSVTIGDSVISIGEWAFDSCTSLTSVTIPDSVRTIGEYAFYDCDSLTSVTIGDSVTSIGAGAFKSCTSLTSITIPDSVTSIGEDAFYYCKSLTDVYYHGTEEEWNAIYISYDNTPLKSATRHYVVSVTLLNPDGTEYAKIMQPMGTALDMEKIPATEGASISVYKDSDMTQEYDLDTIINKDTVLYVKVMVGIKAKLSEDKKQLEVQPFGISEGSKILVAFYQDGKFQQVQPETYKGEALFFPVNQAYTDIKIMAWQNFDTLKSLCVPEELPIQ